MVQGTRQHRAAIHYACTLPLTLAFAFTFPFTFAFMFSSTFAPPSRAPPLSLHPASSGSFTWKECYFLEAMLMLLCGVWTSFFSPELLQVRIQNNKFNKSFTI